MPNSYTTRRRPLPPNPAIGLQCPLLASTLEVDLRSVEAGLHGLMMAVGGPLWTYFDETFLALGRIEKRLGVRQ